MVLPANSGSRRARNAAGCRGVWRRMWVEAVMERKGAGGAKGAAEITPSRSAISGMPPALSRGRIVSMNAYRRASVWILWLLAVLVGLPAPAFSSWNAQPGRCGMSQPVSTCHQAMSGSCCHSGGCAAMAGARSNVSSSQAGTQSRACPCSARTPQPARLPVIEKRSRPLDTPLAFSAWVTHTPTHPHTHALFTLPPRCPPRSYYVHTPPLRSPPHFPCA